MPPSIKDGLPSHTRRVVNTVVLLFLLLGLGWFVLTNRTLPGWDFRNNLWTPAYLLQNGQSPYRVDLLFEQGRALWMPMAIGFFFPLGLLSLQQTTGVWLVSSVVGLLLLIWLSSGQRRPPIPALALMAFAIFTFPPVATHLVLGQFTIAICTIFVIVVYFREKLPLFVQAFLMAVALSNPQLAVLVLPGFLVFQLGHGSLRRTMQFVALLLLSILLLTVPLFLGYPRWFPDFLAALRQNPAWAHASSLTVLSLWSEESGTAIWVLLFLTLFAGNLWIWLKVPVELAVLISMGLTPLVTPYVWSWDFDDHSPVECSVFSVQGRTDSLDPSRGLPHLLGVGRAHHTQWTREQPSLLVGTMVPYGPNRRGVPGGLENSKSSDMRDAQPYRTIRGLGQVQASSLQARSS